MFGKSLVLYFIWICLFSVQAHAEGTTIIADADFMERNTPLKTLTLKGSVNVIVQQQHLLCDHAVVYEDSKTIVATGNVILQSAKTTLRGAKLEFNYETNKGTLYQGVITSGQVLIEADEIIRLDQDSYSADDAYFTSCLTCPPSWGFTSNHIDADIGGYAYINRPWLHLLQFPVLPLPYLVVPLNSKRQTGVLVPKQSSNPDGGFTLELPFYWAIDRSQDATISLINYEKRGQQIFGNYRYVVSETSSGELNTSFLKDRVFSRQDRWFLEYRHHYDLPEGFTQRTALALASDSYYPRDFPNQMQYLGQAALDNRNSLSKAFENSLLTIDSSYYMSLIEPGQDPVFPKIDTLNSNSLHRMPEINYHIVDQKISEDFNLFFNLDMQYINISRQGLAFEQGLSGPAECAPTDGSPTDQAVCYQQAGSSDFVYGAPFGQPGAYGDLIRTGQRLDVMPTVHAPFWIGSFLDIDPSFSVRYTQYALGVESDPGQGYSSTPSRVYTQFGVSGRSYISKVFNFSEEKIVKHSIVPEVNLRYIPRIHQSRHNFFGSGETLRYFREQQPIDNADLDWRNGGRGVQFDNRDRVIGKQLATFSVTNKLISRTKGNSTGASQIGSRYNQDLLLRVSQALDINEASRGADARPWQDIQTDLIFQTGPLSQSVSTQTFPYHSWTNWQASTRYYWQTNIFTQLTYRNFATINIDPPVDSGARGEFAQMSLGFNLKTIQFIGSLEYNLNPPPGGQAFVRWDTMATITPPGECWSLLFGLQQFMQRPVINPTFSMEFQFSE